MTSGGWIGSVLEIEFLPDEKEAPDRAGWVLTIEAPTGTITTIPSMVGHRHADLGGDFDAALIPRGLQLHLDPWDGPDDVIARLDVAYLYVDMQQGIKASRYYQEAAELLQQACFPDLAEHFLGRAARLRMSDVIRIPVATKSETELASELWHKARLSERKPRRNDDDGGQTAMVPRRPKPPTRTGGATFFEPGEHTPHKD